MIYIFGKTILNSVDITINGVVHQMWYNEEEFDTPTPLLTWEEAVEQFGKPKVAKEQPI